LVYGARAFTLDTATRQACFRASALHQGITQGKELLSDRLQKTGALLKSGLAKGVERGPGQGAGPLHIGRSAAGEQWFERSAGRRIYGAVRSPDAAHGYAADEHVAGELQGGLPPASATKQPPPA
jgi:hypothetical protein